MNAIISLALSLVLVFFAAVSFIIHEAELGKNQNSILAALIMATVLILAMYMPSPQKGIIKKVILNIIGLAGVGLIGYVVFQIGELSRGQFIGFCLMNGAIISGMLIFIAFGETIARRLVPRFLRQ